MTDRAAEWLEALDRPLPLPVTFKLPPAVLEEATSAGHRRQAITGRRNADAHNLAATGDPLQRHIEGCWYEAAFSWVTGIPWVAVVEDYRTLGGNDVGGNGVRGTTLGYGCLLLHPEDDDWRPYFLVIKEETPLTFTLVGWLSGRDGKVSRWWRTNVPDPAFFVPQAALWRDLPEGVKLVL